MTSSPVRVGAELAVLCVGRHGLRPSRPLLRQLRRLPVQAGGQVLVGRGAHPTDDLEHLVAIIIYTYIC